MTQATNPRVIGTLIGDIWREPSARTKYGLYFEALGRRFPLVDVLDASLNGFERYINALLNFHPSKRLWRERFYKNLYAFKRRSHRVADKIAEIQDRADIVIQVGGLFDSGWDGVSLPRVIYADYTAYLAAQIPCAGRSPFNTRQLKSWIALERRSLQTAVHVCTRSDLVRDSIILDYGVPEGRVTTVGGGINFSPLPTPVSHTGREAPTALFIGKEMFRKGGDLLLKAFAQARRSVPDARLIFLTEDPAPAGLPTVGVEFVKPTWNREVIAGLYSRSHLLVLPSRLETWGDVLLEAMSYGMPCIGVRGQAMEEVISHQETGLLIPPENEEALTQALVRLFSDVELRQKLGNTARMRAEKQYTWDRVVERSIDPINAGLREFYSKNG